MKKDKGTQFLCKDCEYYRSCEYYHCRKEDSYICKYFHLPSVTPQQRTGRWIERFDEIGKWYECDQCHTDWGGPVNYCPNCGAKMEGKE